MRGTANPIAHTHTSPFQMPADGRIRSLAGCFGSNGMKDALDIKVYGNWEMKQPRNRGDSFIKESVNKAVKAKPKKYEWTQPKN